MRRVVPKRSPTVASTSGRQSSRTGKRAALFLAFLVGAFLLFGGRKEVTEQVVREARWSGELALVTIPDNTTHPFQILHFNSDARSLDIIPLKDGQGKSSAGRFRPTHLVPHSSRRDVFYATSEHASGLILTLWLMPCTASAEACDTPYSLSILDATKSGGDDPAHAAFTADGQWLVCANYASGTISILHKLANDLLKLSRTTRLPPSGSRQLQHPHQILRHPFLEDSVFVLVLGQDAIYKVLIEEGEKLRRTLPNERWDADPAIGKGVRHAVPTRQGDALLVVFQNSNTLASIPLDSSGCLENATAHISTLPAAQQISPSYIEKHALSDIKLSTNGKRAFVLNRRVIPPFPKLLASDKGGDSLAVFDVSIKDSISLIGHIELGCRWPREMLVAALTGDDSDLIWVTCVGAEGQGGGVRVVEVDETGRGAVVASWEADPGSWGIAGLEAEG